MGTGEWGVRVWSFGLKVQPLCVCHVIRVQECDCAGMCVGFCQDLRDSSSQDCWGFKCQSWGVLVEETVQFGPTSGFVPNLPEP